ncbi:lytic transglycosylase domain-containing protein [Aquihabitans sp. G128]|uniref:transglycosylase SLT domain-containing protein n=1 Tax=Aquihabitans sp. G128 TaxID=2849779 RepID=UPI001C212644|nr:transglycosylase SLT domain-containing protein [Aquihabitans sp. G128]QXC59676.1 lytic transglycosylase domain-containing protein [Aquihabitans sp. G128]
MSNPQHTAASEDLSVPTTVARRRRTALRVVLPLLALLTVAFATTACSPEETAKDAIAKYWGKNTDCAERIVDRESNFQAGAVNKSSGATGLFQLMPSHAKWIKATYGYEFSEMKDPYKNARVAKGLSNEAFRYWGDGWQPWRIGSGAQRGGGCPA